VKYPVLSEIKGAKESVRGSRSFPLLARFPLLLLMIIGTGVDDSSASVRQRYDLGVDRRR